MEDRNGPIVESMMFPVPSELDRPSPSTRGRCTSKPGPKPVLRRQAKTKDCGLASSGGFFV